MSGKKKKGKAQPFNDSSFTAIPKKIFEMFQGGQITAGAFATYCVMFDQTNFETGIWKGTAYRIHVGTGGDIPLRTVQDNMKKLGDGGLIKSFHVSGEKHDYAVLIHGYPVRTGKWKKHKLDAFATDNPSNPVYESDSRPPETEEDKGETPPQTGTETPPQTDVETGQKSSPPAQVEDAVPSVFRTELSAHSTPPRNDRAMTAQAPRSDPAATAYANARNALDGLDTLENKERERERESGGGAAPPHDNGQLKTAPSLSCSTPSGYNQPYPNAHRMGTSDLDADANWVEVEIADIDLGGGQGVSVTEKVGASIRKWLSEGVPKEKLVHVVKAYFQTRMDPNEQKPGLALQQNFDVQVRLVLGKWEPERKREAELMEKEKIVMAAEVSATLDEVRRKEEEEKALIEADDLLFGKMTSAETATESLSEQEAMRLADCVIKLALEMSDKSAIIHPKDKKEIARVIRETNADEGDLHEVVGSLMCGWDDFAMRRAGETLATILGPAIIHLREESEASKKQNQVGHAVA